MTVDGGMDSYDHEFTLLCSEDVALMQHETIRYSLTCREAENSEYLRKQPRQRVENAHASIINVLIIQPLALGVLVARSLAAGRKKASCVTKAERRRSSLVLSAIRCQATCTSGQAVGLPDECVVRARRLHKSCPSSTLLSCILTRSQYPNIIMVTAEGSAAGMAETMTIVAEGRLEARVAGGL